MGTSAMLTLAVTVWNTDGPIGRIPYVVAVFVVPFVDGTWSVARQALLAGLVLPGQRGRAMNAYGAAQRLGRALGPAVAAVMWGVTGPVGSYALHAATAVVACGLIVQTNRPNRPHQTINSMGSADRLTGSAPSAYPWAAFWVVGIGMLALEALRANRDLLLPLWATTGLTLGERTISTSVAICLALELALFLPAGIAVDAWGSAPVVLTCLATMAVGFGVMAAGTMAAWWAGVVLLGLGNGIGAGIIKTIGAEIAPTLRRATFLGRWTALSAVGALAGPALVVIAASARPALTATAGVGVAAAVWLATAGRSYLMSRPVRRIQHRRGRSGSTRAGPRTVRKVTDQMRCSGIASQLDAHSLCIAEAPRSIAGPVPRRQVVGGAGWEIVKTKGRLLERRMRAAA
jgi:hypothetical protein